MANMKYCQFENTLEDLRECFDTLEENDFDAEEVEKNASSPQEKKAVSQLISLCEEIAEYCE